MFYTVIGVLVVVLLYVIFLLARRKLRLRNKKRDEEYELETMRIPFHEQLEIDTDRIRIFNLLGQAYFHLYNVKSMLDLHCGGLDAFWVRNWIFCLRNASMPNCSLVWRNRRLCFASLARRSGRRGPGRVCGH